MHPDVRKNLLTMKALTEGVRALVMWVAQTQDIAEKAATEEERTRADDLIQFLTPAEYAEVHRQIDQGL